MEDCSGYHHPTQPARYEEVNVRFTLHPLPPDDWCPNNEACPLIVFPTVREDEAESLAGWFEALFEKNGWPPAWRYTIYDYRHYHSNTHEVIAVYRGTATVRFGDGTGMNVSCKPGDVIVIPAGVSHQRLESSEDFQAVGAYPKGYSPDEIRPDQKDIQQATREVARLPIPPLDPVAGAEGPVRTAWPH